MAKTVLGVFHSKDKAEEAVHEIKERGFKESEISVVTKDEGKGGRGGDRGMTMQTGGRVSGGVSTGAALGGVAGLLAGAGALAIPGIGPIVAAGPIAAALSGAVTGGLAGGLIDWGIPEERGKFYESKVKEGKVLCIVKTSDEKADQISEVFKKTGASDVESHWTD